MARLLAELSLGQRRRTSPVAGRVSLLGVVPNLGRLPPTSSRPTTGIAPLRRATAEVMVVKAVMEALLVRRGRVTSKDLVTLSSSRKTTTTRHITKGNTRNSKPANPLIIEPEN